MTRRPVINIISPRNL